MSAAAPWSVKGIDPKAREVAKDLARRSGMTLGEWLNTMIMDDEDDGVQPLPVGRRPHASEIFERRGRSRRLDDAYDGPASSADDTLLRVAASVEAIADRLEASERRSTVAIQGVDQAVAGLVRRLDGQEQTGKAYGRRIDDIAEELREGHRRLRRFETEIGPSTAESVGKVEAGVNALASRLYDIEERQRTGVNELRQRLDTVETSDVAGKLDTALSALTSRLYDIEERQRVGNETLRQRMELAEKAAGPGPGSEMLAQVGSRLDTAQAATTEALKGLERSFAGLDQRLRTAEGRVEPEGAREAARFEKLAETLSRQVEANRTEMMRRLETAEAEGRMERIERAVVAIGDQAKASEHRSAQGIEAMGREVLRIAQNLNGRMTEVETGGSAAIDKLGQALSTTLATSLTEKMDRDMGRYAQAIDQRLNRTDDQHALALEKLGGEITRISDRLADRIAQSERKSAQAVEDIGRRLTDSSDRIEQRADRASGELSERMRLSEERTARLLAEARDSMERRGDRSGRETPLEGPAVSADLRQPDWRAAAFPGDDFDAEADDLWSSDPLAPGGEPAPFPSQFGAPQPRPVAAANPSARLTQDAPPAVVVAPVDVAPAVFGSRPARTEDAFESEIDAPTYAAVAAHAPVHGSEPFGNPAPFGAFGGADVSDALEATAEAAETIAPVIDADLASPLSGDDAYDAGSDAFDGETEFVTSRGARPILSPEAASRAAATRSTIDAARAAMNAPLAAEEPRSGFGLNIKRGGKSRLQERLDKQAGRDGSTVRKALLASVTSMAVIGGVYATGRLTGGEGFVVPGLDSLSQALGLGAPASAEPTDGATTLAAVALTPTGVTPGNSPTDAVALASPEAEQLYVRALEQLDAGESGGVESLTRAANLGHAGAQLKLAGLYETGESGVTRNAGESRLWARRAAEAGDPRGMHAFGMYLFDGVGGARNRPEALNWLLKAADRGLVDSQYNAARIYENGDEGIAANPAEAFKWYLIAARTGDEQAQISVDRLTPLVPAAGRRTARAAAEAFQTEPLA